MKPARQGQLAGLGAAVLFGCSAPLISTLTGSGSVLSIAGLLYAGATVALLAVRLIRGTRAETPVSRLDIPALAALTVLDGVVGPVALVLGLALLLGQRFPPLPATLALLVIGALGYGISIWLDMLALHDLGAAREAVLFATAPFVGALFSLLVLGDAATPTLLLAAALMAAGVVLLLQEQHSHWHRHEPLEHAHRHRHDPGGSDPHHEHHHEPQDLEGVAADRPFWHAHDHRHGELSSLAFMAHGSDNSQLVVHQATYQSCQWGAGKSNQPDPLHAVTLCVSRSIQQAPGHGHEAIPGHHPETSSKRSWMGWCALARPTSGFSPSTPMKMPTAAWPVPGHPCSDPAGAGGLRQGIGALPAGRFGCHHR